MAMEHYYNPDAAPEGAFEKDSRRRIFVRFKNETDLKDFVTKSGLDINLHTKTYEYSSNCLDC